MRKVRVTELQPGHCIQAKRPEIVLSVEIGESMTTLHLMSGTRQMVNTAEVTIR